MGDGDHPVGTKGCKCSLDGAGYRCDKDKDGISSLCNCDAGQSNVDVGLLTSLDQLPVMKLNYKSSSGMFSWIAYRIGNLECTGKRNVTIYPSEVNKNKMEKIENDIEANTNAIRQNQNDIGQLKERTDENKNEIGRVNNRTADTENEIDQLKERTDENKNEIDEVNNRTAENENEIGQLKERTDEKEKE